MAIFNSYVKLPEGTHLEGHPVAKQFTSRVPSL